MLGLGEVRQVGSMPNKDKNNREIINHKVKSLSDCMEIQLELPLDLSVGTADRIIVEGIQTQERKPTKTFFQTAKSAILILKSNK